MDRSSAGISGQYTRSDNDYNRTNGHATSSRRVQYRHGPVRQRDNPLRTTPGRNEFYHSSAARSSQYLLRRSVNSAQDFNALIKRETMAGLVSTSDRFGHRYDGRNHGQYASSIKKYTSASKRPLNRAEQSQLMRLLQNFTATRSWNWRSLTTSLHSLTSAGVFTPFKPMDEHVKRTQAALLSTLLEVIIFKCNQKPHARDIDAQGVANLLWAIAKLVDNGQEQTPELNMAVAALMSHVSAQKDQFIPQHIANMLWAMAKLVDNGQEQTPELNEAVATLLPHVNAQKANFTPQEINNLLWTMAKLVDNGQEWTPALKETMATLLHQVSAQKNQFIPQHIANLLWAIAKLVDNGQEQTPALNEAVAALLPHMNAQKANFTPQGIANLLWAMAKLVGSGRERAPGLKEAVAALLPQVNAQKADFTPQAIANLLWAMAKLVNNGQEQTPGLKESLAALLPHVNAQKAHFKPQEIANLLWAMAKLVDNGQERTPVLKKAMVALLPHVNIQKAHFKPQEIANLLWALAKLVDNGQERTPKLNEAVAALLPHVNAQKDQFIPLHIANLLWAMAKLLDNGLEQTPELNETVAALLTQVNANKDQFIPQNIANLLWAMAKLGELIELEVVTSTFKSLVYQISGNTQFSQQEVLMSLWGVMVCCARLFLVSNANKNHVFEKHIDDLFTRLEITFLHNEEDQRTIAQAASWLGRACPVIPHYQTIVSKRQSDFRNQLQSCFPSLQIEEEKSLNSLPPVDLLLPDHNMVIEVQGPSHYVGGDFKTRNGSTLLKIALLQKAGFEVIEIPVNRLCNQDLMKPYIDQIKTRIGFQPPGHGSVSLKRRWADAAYVTADKGRQPTDHGYLTAEEHSEEQTGKPAKRKKTNSQ
ncbi:RAP domain-containing protein [Endozoicomonas acroporae]|uniref:RAP domain-containing protein n=1 Tax=Endozoicomonas acroporae TaxID=1701104 RepID=UPI0013D26A75|nr:RAP domain-containing protein [Endozoicomonas acroporae]